MASKDTKLLVQYLQIEPDKLVLGLEDRISKVNILCNEV